MPLLLGRKEKIRNIIATINAIAQARSCSPEFVLMINDRLNVMSGKWKLPIIGMLMFGKKRFKELERLIPKITPRMLSKELKELELNGMVKHTVYDTTPVTVVYELTKSGFSLADVLDEMMIWGLEHRKKMMQRN